MERISPFNTVVSVLRYTKTTGGLLLFTLLSLSISRLTYGDDAGALINPRYDHTATLLADGRVLVAGGLVAGPGYFDDTDSCEIYDPATNS